MDEGEARLMAMFLGWALALYGVRRRDWAGTVVGMIGLGLSAGAAHMNEILSHSA